MYQIRIQQMKNLNLKTLQNILNQYNMINSHYMFVQLLQLYFHFDCIWDLKY